MRKQESVGILYTRVPGYQFLSLLLYLLCTQFKETSRGAYKYTALPCINEPNTPQNVPSDVLCAKDTFFVRTQICSTKLTQNGEYTSTPSQPFPPPP